jgi:C-terminal processing protease CtpA/Prc
MKTPYLLLQKAVALASLMGFPSLPANASTNGVLLLNGKTSYLEVPDSPALHSIPNALTLDLWFNANSFSPPDGDVVSILRKNVEVGKENFFLRFRTRDRQTAVEFSPGIGVGTFRAPVQFRTNTWYHLAATYDGTNGRIFVNGASMSAAARRGIIAIDSSNLMVGRGDPDYSGGEFFAGALDEIRIWNVARSQSQIQAAAAHSLSATNQGPVAYWTFDNAAEFENSPHGEHGELKGDARIVALARPSALEVLSQTEVSSAPPALSGDKRLEILEDLWRHLSETYPALEYKGIFGREWIEPTAERVRNARTDEEFYGLLLELMASLKDTHTRIISYPGQPERQSPPVQLDQVDGKIAVIRADESTGLKPGDVVLTVDDKPADDCLLRQMKRVCNSTDRGRVRGACNQILAGPPGTKITLKVERADHSTQQITLLREAKAFRSEPTVSSKRLTDSLGYIRISRWVGPNLVAQFDQALVEFKNTKGLVIDVRGNGGGSDALADEVNGRFLDKMVVSSIDFWREAGTDHFHKTTGHVQPRGAWTYHGRVAILIDEGCASACEHFVSGMEAIGRVLLVGTPTNGAGGGPTVVTLCDGTKVAISRALGLRANGIVFEGHGIPPHILSTPSIQDLRDGRDAALELSKVWLLSGQPIPERRQPLPSPSF